MFNIKKILLPVDFPNASLSLISQAATLARHFRSELVMLHVVTALSHAAGVPDDGAALARWDLLAAILKEAEKPGAGKKEAEKDLDQSLRSQLDGLAIRCMVVKGEPVEAILQTAQAEDANLIMMPSHGYTFNRFLLGSATAKILYSTECPVWTGAHMEESETPEFAIRNILCAVDLGERSREVVSWAAQMATEFSAHLTLAHVTASVELWGPGGNYSNPRWKNELAGDAARQLAQLQMDSGAKADIFIGSGDVANVLSQAAKQTKADLLVAECYPYGGNLRIHGYAIICAVPIPVLSV